MRGYHYKDSNGRDVLYVPRVFEIISSRRNPKVRLEPNYLERKIIKSENGMIPRSFFAEEVFFDEEDIKTVVQLCYEGKLGEAGDYCVDIFDQFMENSQLNEEDDEFDPQLGYDPDGFDPRFRDSLF